MVIHSYWISGIDYHNTTIISQKIRKENAVSVSAGNRNEYNRNNEKYSIFKCCTYSLKVTGKRSGDELSKGDGYCRQGAAGWLV